MRDKEYVKWIYDGNSFIEKSKPAVYYINLNGIRFLKSLDRYPVTELRKRYREGSRQPSFIAHCLLLADCCIDLETKGRESASVEYSCVREPEYTNPNSRYIFLDELKPHLYFIKQENTGTTQYMLEVIPPTFPRYRVRKRLKDYVACLSNGLWQQETSSQLPIVLIICPSIAELLYAKRLTRRLLENAWDDEDVHIRFTTVDKVKRQGVTSMIWEEV